MNMLSLHNQEVSFLGRPVSPHPHFRRKILFCPISILKPDFPSLEGGNSFSFLKHLVTNIYFGLLSFIPLISDLEVIEDAVLNEGMELLEN